MATFLKDVLYPGRVKPPDLEAPIEFTSEDAPEGVTSSGAVSIPFLGRRFKEMIGAQLQIPVAWEHQDTAKPLSKAEWDSRKADLVKLTLGHAVDGGLDSEGILTTKFEVPGEDDAKKIPALRFISPEIVWDYQDGSGKVWKGPSITHLAVTPRPVQHKQRPFQPVAMSMIRLSLGDYAMADEKKDEKKPDKPEKKEGKEEGKDGGGGDGKLKRALECLAELGMMLGEDTTIENILDRIVVAGDTKKALENPMSTETEQEAQMPAGVALSLTQNIFRPELERRIKALFPSRITKPLRDKLLAEAKTVKLSLDGKTGAMLTNPLLSKIEAYEALEPRADWEEVKLSMGPGGVEREVPHPETPMDAGKTVDGFMALCGHR